MTRYLIPALALGALATSVSAGGIERSPFSTSVLFEDGDWAEFSLGYVMPEVDGEFTAAPTISFGSGDVGGDYFTFGAALKRQVDENWAWAVILDNPVGANVDYTGAEANYPFAGATAEITSVGVTGLVKYTMPNNVSVYGGLRAERLRGQVNDLPVPTGLPAPAPAFTTYDLETADSTALGYVLGAAWERPDIAARVSLTYVSARDHDLEGTESFGGTSVGTETFTSTLPQSVTLDFQTGVAADTLVFGSVKWTDWSEFDITPVALGSSLVDYDNDVVTYSLGVGRRFTENWSGAVTIGYEASDGEPVGNLGPTDGQKSIGVAAIYTEGGIETTFGVRYVDVGDATTSTIGAEFADNSAVALGVKVGYSF